ncbi:MAG: Glu/Leu/Phe/Val dehydrogenase dimerization domain-containing protein [Dehalococcoidia bacterium]
MVVTQNSFFSFMEKNGLTTLQIFYDRRNHGFLLRGTREWEDDLPFHGYNADFTVEDILTRNYFALNSETLVSELRQQGTEEELEHIKRLMREGGHHSVDFYYHRPRNIRVVHCKHVNTLGIRNRRHAIRIGAMRRHELDEPEIDVITDGLNLARAMAYKNAAANIPYGGSKMVVQCDPLSLDDFESLGFLAYVTDRSRSVTGPDMNIQPEVADVIRERFTKNYVGSRKGALGVTGKPTAYGEYLALKEACHFIYGSPDISNRTIAIQGLGEVGYPLAEHLLNEGAKLIVTDIDKSKVDKLQRQWGSSLIQYVEPEGIYNVTADIFSPCAVGGIITEDRIKQFKFKLILGAANNQLRATSKKREIELAKKLAEAGILFVIDWAHNAGGVLCAWAEWLLQEQATFDRLKPKIEAVCKHNFRRLLEEARAANKTPTELVYERTERMVYFGANFDETL